MNITLFNNMIIYMDEYTTNLRLLTEIKELLNDYIRKDSFDSDIEYKNIMKKIYDNSVIINQYINLMKPDPEEQVKCIKYFKIWSNIPPNILPGTFIMDLLGLSRDALDKTHLNKIGFLKIYSEIKKNQGEEDLKDIFQLLQISDMTDLYIQQRGMEIKTTCDALSTVTDGYIKVMIKYKDDLISLSEKETSSSQMSFF